ncbi:hypothetical protein ACOJBO_27825 [Rhizobium beringeri]
MSKQMLYEGLIRGRGATISTQVGGCRCNESGLSNFAQAYLAKRIGISYTAGFASVFPLGQGQPHMPVFEMTDRMLLAELASPDRIELYNIFIYQSVNVSCGGVELHRQLFHARPAQDYWAISRNNTASVPARLSDR